MLRHPSNALSCGKDFNIVMIILFTETSYKSIDKININFIFT